MLRAENLTIEYSKLLFKNISFSLGNKEKVGLVGLNGSGKTTLLRILMGQEIADKGIIEIVNEKVEYLPQEYSFRNGLLVGEVLEELVNNPKTEMYRVNKVLNKLGLTVDIYQEVSTLSEGQKMKLYLTKLLINEPTILLLDEPTNHLDIYGIVWLEEFIKNFEGICIIISHDRAFLNNTVNKVYEIDEQKLNIFEGNYDDYLVQKQTLIEERHTKYVLQERHRQKLVGLIELAGEISDGKRRGKAKSAAKHRLYREVLDKEINDYKEEKLKGLNLEGFIHSNKLVLEIKDLSFSYSGSTLSQSSPGLERKLLMNANFTMYGRERVWFFGSNGIGKTTLIKLITKQLRPGSGEIKIGENLSWTYFSQDQSHLLMNETVEDYFLRGSGMSYNQSFGAMEKFLFTKDMRRTKIGKLSPGQRARLSFAVFSQHKYDFLILDEPTNHLDIRSKEVIENALKEFKGAILLISHDRYFVESIGIDKSLTIKDKQLVEIITDEV